MHRQLALLEKEDGTTAGASGEGLGGVGLEEMVGLVTDSGAMRDLDLNVRRDGMAP